MAESPGRNRDEPVAEPPGRNRDGPVAEPPGRNRVEPVAEPPGRNWDEPVAEPPGRNRDEPVAEPPGRNWDEPVAEPQGRNREEPVAEAPGRNREEVTRTYEADMTLAGMFISLRISGNNWTDKAWTQHCDRGLELLGKQAVKYALESQDRKVNDMQPTESVLVQLCCYTKESFLSFMDDFESGKVKQRLEDEFEKVGYKGELEVTILNENDVYRELDQIR